jgi:hypothetical protein
MLDRFIGTDEGEVTEYLGCELVRDRKTRTGQLIQAGYAERVLRVFNMMLFAFQLPRAMMQSGRRAEACVCVD